MNWTWTTKRSILNFGMNWSYFVLQVAEWQLRAEKFEDMCCSVIQMFTRLSNSANHTILYDLYPYIWDIKSIISMVKSFVQWLGG